MDKTIAILEIYDRDIEIPEVLGDAFSDLLEISKLYAAKLHWAIYYFETCGGWKLPYAYDDIENSNTPTGFKR